MGLKQIIVVFAFALIVPATALAHQPVIEPIAPEGIEQTGIYYRAVQLADPIKSSQALYGSLTKPGEVDVFVFVPENEAEIPLEVLVPIRPANELFKPELIVLAKSITDGQAPASLNLGMDVPEGYQAKVITNNHELGEFFEPFSLERYWKGEELKLKVAAKQNYFLIVRESNSQTGDYSLGAGTAEDFSETSTLQLLGNVASLKLGLVGNTTVPWLDIIGLFLFIAGFVVGLGAVTVIDTLGFLARRSGYWTESTIRAHKVTKPLIWLGLALLLIGAGVTYRESWLTGIALFQAIAILALILNGIFLSFYISPRLLEREKDGKIAEVLPDSLQGKIMVSFIISFLGWWTSLFLLAWYLVMMR